MKPKLHLDPLGLSKILIVEDDEIIQTVHRFMLEKLGFQVDVVDTGQAAIDRTATQDYTAMLLDLGLPDISGEEVIVAIRKREQTTDQHLPIIVNSAHAIEATLQAAREKGADIALLKPVMKEDLKNSLVSLQIPIVEVNQ